MILVSMPVCALIVFDDDSRNKRYRKYPLFLMVSFYSISSPYIHHRQCLCLLSCGQQWVFLFSCWITVLFIAQDIFPRGWVWNYMSYVYSHYLVRAHLSVYLRSALHWKWMRNHIQHVFSTKCKGRKFYCFILTFSRRSFVMLDWIDIQTQKCLYFFKWCALWPQSQYSTFFKGFRSLKRFFFYFL